MFLCKNNKIILVSKIIRIYPKLQAHAVMILLSHTKPCMHEKLKLYWTKVKMLHLNCLPFIYKMMQASKANESVSECSKTWLCITVKVSRMLSTGKTWKPFKCDRGPNFQNANKLINSKLISELFSSEKPVFLCFNATQVWPILHEQLHNSVNKA